MGISLGCIQVKISGTHLCVFVWMLTLKHEVIGHKAGHYRTVTAARLSQTNTYTTGSTTDTPNPDL